jgi:hypothetical protein
MEERTVRDVLAENLDRIIEESLRLPHGWEAEVYLDEDGHVRFSAPLSPNSWSQDQRGTVGRIEASAFSDYGDIPYCDELTPSSGAEFCRDEEGNIYEVNRGTVGRKLTLKEQAEAISVSVDDLVEWGWIDDDVVDENLQEFLKREYLK